MTALVLAMVASPKTSFAQGATPTFKPVISTYTNSSYNFPAFAAVGDFNRDGKLDALVTDGSDNLRLMLGNGDGTFTEHDIYVPGANPGAIQAADFNRDGKLDAVLVSNGGNQQATVLLNTGNDGNGVPQFAITNYSPGFGQVRSVSVGDLNGDGYPDFIVGGAYSQLRVYLNQGDGTFSAGQFTTILPNAGGPSVGPGFIADLNGDGKADYIVTSNQANATNIFFGNGDGTFQAPIVIPGNYPMSVVVEDMNKDGVPDVVEGTQDGRVLVYLNNGGGTFGTPTSYPIGTYWVTSLAIADVNGDGNPDVVTGNYWNYGIADPGKTVAVLTGNGKGALGTAQLFPTNIGPLSVALGDFNGDDKLDIATVGYDDRSYGVLLNTTVTVPPLVFTGLQATPSALWPPDHKLQSITLKPTFTGGLAPITWHIVSVSSNEPVNSGGDGNSSPDWVIGSNGQSLQLRAERSGSGNGRIYTITVEIDDGSSPAQKATMTVTVTVPHDQGKH